MAHKRGCVGRALRGYEKREKRKQQGLCSQCGKENDKERGYCSKCRKYQKDWYRAKVGENGK